jgi:PEP-CTERM motif
MCHQKKDVCRILFGRIRSMKCFLAVLAALATLLGGTGQGRADPTFFDGTFDNADWGSQVFLHGNGGSSIGIQNASGGNPGSFWQITNTINAAPGAGEFSSVWAFYNRIGADYNPSIQGAIASIDSSQDAIDLSFYSPAIEVGLSQDGFVYVTGGIQPMSTSWNSVAFPTLMQDDFFQIDPVQGYPTDFNAHPDFSAAGSTIEFGFVRANSTGIGGPGYSTISGADNWSLTVHPADVTGVPEPATVTLLAIGGCGLWFYRRRNRSTIRQ